MECNCRCINCKSPRLTSNNFVASDGYEDSHHTCMTCGIPSTILDGEQFNHCDICEFHASIKRKDKGIDHVKSLSLDNALSNSSSLINFLSIITSLMVLLLDIASL